MMPDKIEILSLNMFQSHEAEIEIVERLQKKLKQGIGWHYYLDLAWLIKELNDLPRGSVLLDAGAGYGLTQFILAELGYNVISADFVARTFSHKYLKRYGRLIYNLNEQDDSFDNPYTRHLKKNFNIALKKKPISRIDRLFRRLLNRFGNTNSPPGTAVSMIEKHKYRPSQKQQNRFDKTNTAKDYGKIFIYKCDLKDMSLLPDNFVDGVVSVSALEHNEHKDIKNCVAEILRITKPSGPLLLTVSASLSTDWFHQPSKGWCFCEGSLKDLFDLPENVCSNYSEKENIFNLLKQENNELHARLAPFYFKSGDNGMPWGRWKPEYQPVGIRKIKSI